VVPLYENHTTYFKIADYLVIFGYEFIILTKLDRDKFAGEMLSIQAKELEIE
jgi:hypothetical protein